MNPHTCTKSFKKQIRKMKDPGSFKETNDVCMQFSDNVFRVNLHTFKVEHSHEHLHHEMSSLGTARAPGISRVSAESDI